VQRQQVVLLQRLGLQLPDGLRPQCAVPGQGQREAAFRLVASQARRRVQQPLQVVALRKVLGIARGQLAGDALQLGAVGQGVLDHHEQLLQLDGDLHHRRQHHQERAPLLARGQLDEGGLHHLRRVQEPVKVVQEEQGRAVGLALGEGGQGAEGGQRVAGGGLRGRTVAGRAGQAQAVGHVPGGRLPTLVVGEAQDFALGLVGLGRLDPEAAEGRLDVVGQLLGQRHATAILSLIGEEIEEGPGA
jgi:hypothetical protein